MVRYYSDDGVFDAPVQKVWQLIQAHGEHAQVIHPSIISRKANPQPDGSITLDVTVKDPDGKPMSQRWHMMAKPPYAQSVDFLDGPMKGSWLTTTYIPEGDKTRAVTAAEWRVQGITDEATLRKMANDFFDNGFEEDQRYLKTMK